PGRRRRRRRGDGGVRRDEEVGAVGRQRQLRARGAADSTSLRWIERLIDNGFDPVVPDSCDGVHRHGGGAGRDHRCRSAVGRLALVGHLGDGSVVPGADQAGAPGAVGGHADRFLAHVDGAQAVGDDARPHRAQSRGAARLARLMAIIPVFVTFAIVPFGATVCPHKLTQIVTETTQCTDAIGLQTAKTDVGLIFYFAIASLAVYGTTLAGWASYNKWSLLG